MSGGLLIGLGAAKSGTSWLHRYLAGHPGCHPPPLKEMHWFDTVESGRTGWRVKALRRERDRVMEGEAPMSRVERIDRYLALFERDEMDDAAYLGLLSDGAGGRMRFEITPSYSILSDATTARMARLEGARFVFLMRDPVARMWSNIRMGARRRGGSEAQIEARARAMMEEATRPEGESHRARSAYGDILPKLRRAIPDGRLFTAFYEELFRQETVDSLCDFAGIARRPAETGRRVHAGTPIEIDPGLAARARDVLAPHYDATRRILGRVPEGWMAPQEIHA